MSNSEMAAKVCLVTGASSGIGHATALELLRGGHIVYGGARRAHLMAAIREAGGHPLPMDVTKEEDLQRAVRTILDEHDRIDVLVNNAGTVVHGAVEDTPIDREFDARMTGPLIGPLTEPRDRSDS